MRRNPQFVEKPIITSDSLAEFAAEAANKIKKRHEAGHAPAE
jgi:hypothetical protein